VAVTRFAATVSYDGTDFVGSQRQPNGRTVQEQLERAVAAVFGAPAPVAMAGRTDSGVHAIGQVAAFTVDTRLDPTTAGRALNANLADDLAVRDVRAVDPGFDPRRWARKRWYRYTVWNGEVRSPLCRRTTWHVAGDLDVDAMDRAASSLEGRRDFLACSGPLDEGRTSVRTVFSSRWQASGPAITFDITADAFLPQMVRRLTGALIRVGRGTLNQEEFVRLLAEARLATIGPAAPPQGLCLQQVDYDEGYTP
jgi:tRNA pseudouridine38-40 synthase